VSIKASIAWTAGSQVFGSLLQFASSVILARTLVPEEVGVFAVGAATMGILAIIQQLGLPALIIRAETITKDLQATAFTVNLVFSIAVSLTVAIAGFFASVLFDDNRVEHVMYVLAICPLVLSLCFLPGAHLERDGNFKALALAATVSSMALAMSTIAFLGLGLRYMSLAYGQLVGSAVTSATIIWAGRSFPTVIFGLNEWRRIAAFSSRIVLIGGAYNLSQRISELSLARLADVAALGLYNRASSISALIWHNIHSIIGRVYLVDFARAHREKLDLSPRYIGTASVLIALMWPAYFGIALLSPFVLTAIYGANWAAAAVTLSLLCIAAAVATSVSLAGELFLATGNVATQARLEVQRAIISTILFVTGALISLEAAAATRIIDAFLAMYFYRPHVKAMANVTSRDFLSLYKGGVILTALALAPSATVLAFAPHALLHLGILSAVILAGVVLWGLGLHLLGHPLLGPLHKLIELRRARGAK
jgi:O-antigen/teichoic acid export membrane protein